MEISPRSDCALIGRLLYTWSYPFRNAALVFLRKRKTITQRRRKSSEEGARQLTRVPGIRSRSSTPVRATSFPPREGKLGLGSHRGNEVGISKRPGGCWRRDLTAPPTPGARVWCPPHPFLGAKPRSPAGLQRRAVSDPVGRAASRSPRTPHPRLGAPGARGRRFPGWRQPGGREGQAHSVARARHPPGRARRGPRPRAAVRRPARPRGRREPWGAWRRRAGGPAGFGPGSLRVPPLRCAPAPPTESERPGARLEA